MSTQRIAIVTALATHHLMKNNTDTNQYNNRGQFERQERPNGTQFHGNVNYLLGGAMLSVMMTVVCFVCYCCHRNLRKRSEAIYRQRWLEAEANMEIYSVTQCYDMNRELREVHHQNTASPSLTPASISHGPPPSYDAVVAMDQDPNNCDKCYRTHLNRRSCELPKYTFGRVDSEDSMIDSENNYQILHAGHLNNRIDNHNCNGNTEINGFDLIRKCRGCGQEMTVESNQNETRSMETCSCGSDPYLDNRMGQPEDAYLEQDSSTSRRHIPRIVNTNEASTSAANNNEASNNNEESSFDVNGNVNDVGDLNRNTDNRHTLNSITDNGIIRLDMSQIIDRTGLPTYEAAIKLESSGYV